jgi:hypothetical protein
MLAAFISLLGSTQTELFEGEGCSLYYQLVASGSIGRGVWE